MIYCDKCGIVPVPEKDLPVLLPEDAEFKPTGESPLKYCEAFVNTTCPKCGGPAERETDTMDTFMCSSWYFLRYYQPHDAEYRLRPGEDEILAAGGHVHRRRRARRDAPASTPASSSKPLRDMGLVDFDEPFTRLFNQGTIICGQQKMSKSRGNVVNPDKYVTELGADTVRAYLMFIGPWELGRRLERFRHQRHLPLVQPRLESVPGRVCSRRFRPAAEAELIRKTHQTIRKVSTDIDRMQFNTMLAALMEFTNYLAPPGKPPVSPPNPGIRPSRALILMLAPTAPHLAEELWTRTGHEYSVHNQSFPPGMRP